MFYRKNAFGGPLRPTLATETVPRQRYVALAGCPLILRAAYLTALTICW